MAFGIGIDVPNIRRVIHVGVPHTIEEFFQEAGRCGRDGLPASSTVYYNNRDISSSHTISQDMIDYVSLDACKREKILHYFGYSLSSLNQPAHMCCDNHAKTCNCDECLLAATSTLSMEDQEQQSCSSSPVDQPLSQWSLEKKAHLREKLIAFRHTLHGSGKSCVGSLSLCTGFSMELVEEIIANASTLKSLEDIEDKLPLFNTDHAVPIFQILEDIRYEDDE